MATFLPLFLLYMLKLCSLDPNAHVWCSILFFLHLVRFYANFIFWPGTYMYHIVKIFETRNEFSPSSHRFKLDGNEPFKTVLNITTNHPMTKFPCGFIVRRRFERNCGRRSLLTTQIFPPKVNGSPDPLGDQDLWWCCIIWLQYWWVLRYEPVFAISRGDWLVIGVI